MGQRVSADAVRGDAPAAWNMLHWPTRTKIAHEGEGLQMYYDTALKKWLDKGQAEAGLGADNGPPPPPTLAPVPNAAPRGARKLTDRYARQNDLAISLGIATETNFFSSSAPPSFATTAAPSFFIPPPDSGRTSPSSRSSFSNNYPNYTDPGSKSPHTGGLVFSWGPKSSYPLPPLAAAAAFPQHAPMTLDSVARRDQDMSLPASMVGVTGATATDTPTKPAMEDAEQLPTPKRLPPTPRAANASPEQPPVEAQVSACVGDQASVPNIPSAAAAATGKQPTAKEDYEQQLAARAAELEARFEAKLAAMRQEVEAKHAQHMKEQEVELASQRLRCAELQDEVDQLLLCLGQESRKVLDLSCAMKDAGLDADIITARIEEEYASIDLVKSSG